MAVSFQKIHYAIEWHTKDLCNKIARHYTFDWLPTFYRWYCDWKIKRLRKKASPINVVFVVQELAIWKSEMLYLKMVEHPRFKPVVAITETLEVKDAHLAVIEYCKEKNYDYVILDKDRTITEQLPTDILLYQKPYPDKYYQKHFCSRNTDAIIIHVPYAFHAVIEEWNIWEQLYILAWHHYFENEYSVQLPLIDMPCKGRNVRITGTPTMDELLLPKETYDDPWKCRDQRKRIIYAPHHTIGGLCLAGIAYSTFLERGEFILRMAEKYRDSVYFAFKPHPLLYTKLLTVWGKEKTEAYYAKWRDAENSQLETGKYMGLFHYSDAIIHDCGSFTQEYLYTKNPAFFITADVEEHTHNTTMFTQKCFEQYYTGQSEDEIEQFIVNVVNGTDPKREDRIRFFEASLRPPYGRTACENIINEILGI